MDDKFPCFGTYNEKNIRCSDECPDSALCILCDKKKEIKDDKTSTTIGGTIDLYS